MRYKTAIDYAREENYHEIILLLSKDTNQDIKFFINQNLELHREIQRFIQEKQSLEKKLNDYQYLQEVNDSVQEILNNT